MVHCLEKLDDEQDDKAHGLLTGILQFYFIVGLVILSSVLLLTKTLSSKLQYSTMDLNDAAEYCKTTITALRAWSFQEEEKAEEKDDNTNEVKKQQEQKTSQTEFQKLYDEARRIALVLGVDETWPREMRRQPAQQQLYQDLQDYYRKKQFLPFISTMIDELETRLAKPEPFFRATWLIPKNLNFNLTTEQLVDHLTPIFDENSPYYDDVVQRGDILVVQRELISWVGRWREKNADERPKKILQCLNSVNMCLYPNVKVVFLVFLTLPVTTCSVERSFSEMRLLKTWLRSSMTDERLSALALMHFNYELEIPYEKLIIKWSQLKDRLIDLDLVDWLEEAN